MAMTLDDLVELPWTWQGPNRITDSSGTSFEYRIEELPDFFVLGASLGEARREAVPALRAFLQSYLESGEVPTLPNSTSLWRFVVPWRSPTSEVRQPIWEFVPTKGA